MAFTVEGVQFLDRVRALAVPATRSAAMGYFIKWVSAAAIVLAVRGCQRAESASPPVVFLGLAEDQEENVGGTSALANLAKVTAVETVGYDEYLRRAKAGDIQQEETHGRWVYWIGGSGHNTYLRFLFAGF